MAAGARQQPHDNTARRQRARLAASCQIMGVAVGIATLTFSVLGVISAQQAVALGLPTVVLISGGLIVAATLNPSSSGLSGFRVGLRVGTILWGLSSPVRRRRTLTEWHESGADFIHERVRLLECGEWMYSLSLYHLRSHREDLVRDQGGPNRVVLARRIADIEHNNSAHYDGEQPIGSSLRPPRR